MTQSSYISYHSEGLGRLPEQRHQRQRDGITHTRVREPERYREPIQDSPAPAPTPDPVPPPPAPKPEPQYEITSDDSSGDSSSGSSHSSGGSNGGSSNSDTNGGQTDEQGFVDEYKAKFTSMLEGSYKVGGVEVKKKHIAVGGGVAVGGIVLIKILS